MYLDEYDKRQLMDEADEPELFGRDQAARSGLSAQSADQSKAMAGIFPKEKPEGR